MSKHTTDQILEAVSNMMASGVGFERTGNTDYFNSIVELDGVAYRVIVAWPDDAQAHEVEPIIRKM